MTAPLTAMRAQFAALMDDGWSVACAVTRFNGGTTDGAGHKSAGSFGSVATSEKIWIQAVAGRSQIKEQGLDAETTHLAFQKYSGYALMPKDRILPSGQTYAYDVVRAHVLESHRMAELKQVLRT
jgi:hypothetical protein